MARQHGHCALLVPLIGQTLQPQRVTALPARHSNLSFGRCALGSRCPATSRPPLQHDWASGGALRTSPGEAAAVWQVIRSGARAAAVNRRVHNLKEAVERHAGQQCTAASRSAQTCWLQRHHTVSLGLPGQCLQRSAERGCLQRRRHCCLTGAEHTAHTCEAPCQADCMLGGLQPLQQWLRFSARAHSVASPAHHPADPVAAAAAAAAADLVTAADAAAAAAATSAAAAAVAQQPPQPVQCTFCGLRPFTEDGKMTGDGFVRSVTADWVDEVANVHIWPLMHVKLISVTYVHAMDGRLPGQEHSPHHLQCLLQRARKRAGLR